MAQMDPDSLIATYPNWASLHKWFLAPRGTSFLSMAKGQIKNVSPLFPPAAKVDEDDIGK